MNLLGNSGNIAAGPASPSFLHVQVGMDAGKAAPELKGKFIGTVFCVPTHNVSFVDLTCYPEKDTTLGGIKKAVKLLWNDPLKDVLGYPVTNSDVHSSTFDAGPGVTLSDHFV